jgi:hypothetical protein
MPRNYRKEYDGYHSSSKQKKNRASRNAARKKIGKRMMGSLKGKDIHHKDGNPRNNDSSNLSVTSRKYNRSKK